VVVDVEVVKVVDMVVVVTVVFVADVVLDVELVAVIVMVTTVVLVMASELEEEEEVLSTMEVSVEEARDVELTSESSLLLRFISIASLESSVVLSQFPKQSL